MPLHALFVVPAHGCARSLASGRAKRLGKYRHRGWIDAVRPSPARFAHAEEEAFGTIPPKVSLMVRSVSTKWGRSSTPVGGKCSEIRPASKRGLGGAARGQAPAGTQIRRRYRPRTAARQ